MFVLFFDSDLDDDIAVAGNVLAPSLTGVLHHLLAPPVLTAVHSLHTHTLSSNKAVQRDLP